MRKFKALFAFVLLVMVILPLTVFSYLATTKENAAPE